NQRHRRRTHFHAIHAVSNHLPYGINTALDESGVEAAEQAHFTKGCQPCGKANVGGREHRAAKSKRLAGQLIAYTLRANAQRLRGDETATAETEGIDVWDAEVGAHPPDLHRQ